MKIAVNTRCLLPEKMEGYDYFIQELFCRIANNNPQHEFFFLFDEAFDHSVTGSANIYPLLIKPRAKYPLLRKIWYNWQVPKVLKTIKADAFVNPGGSCSLQTKVPQCMIVHDLVFAHHPQFIRKTHVSYYKKNMPLFLKKAKTIATLSDFSKRDICNLYHISPEKISVVYSTAHPFFIPLPEEEKENVKQQYASGAEYFLFTGTGHPKHNLINLLKAYSVFKKKQKSSMKLVLAGRIAKEAGDFVQLLQTYKFRNDVILTGHVAQEELARLVASAYAMVYPSFFEGFSASLLEAFQCGVPAVVSNTGALPETGGNACLYFNPNDFEDMAVKMTKIYKDESMRTELVRFGRERLAQFSWNQTADAMWSCIMKTASAD